MPRKNTQRFYQPHSYYHVYNRGVEKREIFLDQQDYAAFLNLLKRYLSPGVSKDEYGRDGRSFYGDIELISYCLMPNHYHLLVYIEDKPEELSHMMSRVATSYAMYFNKKYQRVGYLFQGRFKSVPITSDAYLEHISRYIHLNPKDYKIWPYSSYGNYENGQGFEWLHIDRLMEIFGNNREEYLKFISDYEDQKAEIDGLK